MKKYLLTALFIALLFTITALFSSCAHEHKFGEWKITKAATCTEAGEKERVCSSCGEKEVGTVAAKGHTVVTDAAFEPTCAEEGKTEGSHCSVCGEVFTAQESIPRLEHTVVVDPAVEPTCTEKGKTEGSHCSVCGEVITAQKTVSAKGHSVAVEEGVAATCTKEGLTAKSYCTVCGETIREHTKISPLGHTNTPKCERCKNNNRKELVQYLRNAIKKNYSNPIVFDKIAGDNSNYVCYIDLAGDTVRLHCDSEESDLRKLLYIYVDESDVMKYTLTVISGKSTFYISNEKYMKKSDLTDNTIGLATDRYNVDYDELLVEMQKIAATQLKLALRYLNLYLAANDYPYTIKALGFINY